MTLAIIALLNRLYKYFFKEKTWEEVFQKTETSLRRQHPNAIFNYSGGTWDLDPVIQDMRVTCSKDFRNDYAKLKLWMNSWITHPTKPDIAPRLHTLIIKAVDLDVIKTINFKQTNNTFTRV